MAKVEVMENQLEVIVKSSGLDTPKAKYILDKFTDYFNIAAEWEIKAKSIKVTNASQTAEMQMARVGRLFLKEKRVAIEKARKELKEQALREGKAIDGISNVLKSLIEPIENYLDRQERFVEIQEEEKREAMRIEVEKRIEDERIAKEKADAEALAKAQIENEKLKAEAIEREKKIAKERADAEKKRKEAEAIAREAGEKAAAKLLKEKREKDKLAAELKAQEEEAEEKARLEKEKQEKTLANEKAKAKRLKELAEEKAQAILEAERAEKERLEEVLKSQVECPKCHHRFNLKEK